MDVLIGTLDLPLCLNPVPNRFCPTTRVAATSTIFGWTVTGPLPPTQQVPALKVELKEDETHSLCQQLWDMEKVPEVSRHTPEEESALQQFSSHLTRESDGRYSVKLPRVHYPPQLGDSRRMATSRFLSNERSLLRKGKLDQLLPNLKALFPNLKANVKKRSHPLG